MNRPEAGWSARATILAVPFLLVGGTAAWLTRDWWNGIAVGLVGVVAAALVGEAWRWPLLKNRQALEQAISLLQRELPRPEGTMLNGQAGVEAALGHARELMRQLNTLSSVLDGMLEGVWITDLEGTVIRHNDALKAMFYAGQELVGLRPVEIVRNGELAEAVRRACAQGESKRLELSIEGVRPRALAVQVSPLGKEVGGSAAVFHDLTELRRLEKVRTDFVANVSHELRTPITAIRGYAETLRTGALSDPAHAPAMVEIIHRQSMRLSELVEDLLELSRIESKELQLASVPVSLAQAAVRAAEAVRPKSKLKEVEVELAISESLTSIGDARAVEQICLNLLDNAIKYTPMGGRVRVTGQVEAGQVLLLVSDTGVGLEPRHLPRIFERFYRVDKGRSRDMGGTGLGLSIVKHLATAMGGDVQVVSRPGAGSTFTVTLPKG